MLLCRTGSIKVADFGIARFLRSATQTMTDKAIGSVHYIGPEQASGDHITDARSDIYSVGVMIFEMLTGKLPFEADNAGIGGGQADCRAKPALPRSMNPDIPEGLQEIADARHAEGRRGQALPVRRRRCCTTSTNLRKTHPLFFRINMNSPRRCTSKTSCAISVRSKK